MAFPKKGSRVIEVEGVRYRYIGLFAERDRAPDEVHALRVQLADGPRQVLRAEFGYAVMKAAYARVGKHVSRWIDTAPPYLARQAILLGLREGWRPDTPGSEHDLGNIDARIDWTALRPNE